MPLQHQGSYKISESGLLQQFIGRLLSRFFIVTRFYGVS
jgi:hypothetical protein